MNLHINRRPESAPYGPYDGLQKQSSSKLKIVACCSLVIIMLGVIGIALLPNKPQETLVADNRNLGANPVNDSLIGSEYNANTLSQSSEESYNYSDDEDFIDGNDLQPENTIRSIDTTGEKPELFQESSEDTVSDEGSNEYDYIGNDFDFSGSTAAKTVDSLKSLPSRGVCALTGCVAKPTGPKRITIVGDSITAQHKNQRKYGKGWWHYLGEASKAKITLSAQGGSGYVRKGKNCSGTTFGERLGDIKRSKPTTIIVEGGRNDAMLCVNGRFNRASSAQINQQVSSYMDQLVVQARNAGVPANRIIVFVPWGSSSRDKHAQVEPIIRNNAKRIGAKYVYVAPYGGALTRDGTHPSPSGSKYIYDSLRKAGVLNGI